MKIVKIIIIHYLGNVWDAANAKRCGTVKRWTMALDAIGRSIFHNFHSCHSIWWASDANASLAQVKKNLEFFPRPFRPISLMQFLWNPRWTWCIVSLSATTMSSSPCHTSHGMREIAYEFMQLAAAFELDKCNNIFQFIHSPTPFLLTPFRFGHENCIFVWHLTLHCFAVVYLLFDRCKNIEKHHQSSLSCFHSNFFRSINWHQLQRVFSLRLLDSFTVCRLAGEQIQFWSRWQEDNWTHIDINNTTSVHSCAVVCVSGSDGYLIQFHFMRLSHSQLPSPIIMSFTTTHHSHSLTKSSQLSWIENIDVVDVVCVQACPARTVWWNWAHRRARQNNQQIKEEKRHRSRGLTSPFGNDKKLKKKIRRSVGWSF